PSIRPGGVYEVSDRIPAGYVGRTLEPGTFARIFTGAPVPQGADAVVIQENTEEVEGGVKLNVVPGRHENIRPRGQDIASGEVILE
ncbi:MAG: molybdopterin molybdenumtransferase MoeA, partial [Desulfuromonadales bacterium]|nr:molybdopterin molybdenumtransferase MoeA [Desulfuromonadales bacterium]